MPSWQISGQYMETCNCQLLCPCITSNLTARPTDGKCYAAAALRITQGAKDGVTLDGLSFVIVFNAPGPMAQGNMVVGLIVDEAASEEQTAAIVEIASGKAGGPAAALAPLVGSFAGVEKKRIEFTQDGFRFSVKAGDLLDQACEGVASAVKPGDTLYIDNVAHPVNSRLGIAKAIRSRFHVFGIDWEDTSGTRNGHFAPFSWSA